MNRKYTKSFLTCKNTNTTYAFLIKKIIILLKYNSYFLLNYLKLKK